MGPLDEVLFGLARQYARCAEALLGDELVSVVLFGSVARRQCRSTSDIDLIVILRDAPKTSRGRRAILAPVRAELDPALENLWRDGLFTDFTEVILSMDEARKTHRLFLEVIEDGVILYDRNGFFAGVLERLRGALRRMGAQRKTFGNLRYWDLKPDFKPGDVVEI